MMNESLADQLKNGILNFDTFDDPGKEKITSELKSLSLEDFGKLLEEINGSPWGESVLCAFYETSKILHWRLVKDKVDAWHRDFSSGYLCACATLVKSYGAGDEVKDLLYNGGFKLSDLQKYEIDAFDREALEPIMKKMEKQK